MKKKHINLFTPSLFTWSIYEIIYAASFKDYRDNIFTESQNSESAILIVECACNKSIVGTIKFDSSYPKIS